MKKLRIAVLLVTVISLVGLFLACPSSSSSTTPPTEVPKVPKLSDYDIKGIADIFVGGTFPTVTVALKSGVDGSPATPVVKYALNDGTPSTSTPSTAQPGKVTVTFDVAAVTGWVGIDGFSAGTVIINSPDLKTPEFVHYDITNLPPTALTVGGSFAGVTVAPKGTNGSLYSQSTPSVTYTRGGQTISLNAVTAVAGQVYVDFSVAVDDTNKWNAANFRAGIIYVQEEGEVLEITEIAYDDFEVKLESASFPASKTLTVEYNNAIQRITVTPKNTGKAARYPGSPVVTYYDAASTTPRIDAAANAGDYKAHVSVPGAVNSTNTEAWQNLEFDLTYTIRKRVPVVTDYVVYDQNQAAAGKLLQSTNWVRHVFIDPKPTNEKVISLSGSNYIWVDKLDSAGKPTPVNGISSPGARTIHYTYIAGTNTNTADNAELITAWTGSNNSFTETNVTASVSDATKRGPQKAGSYKVTLDVAAPSTTADAANWDTATGIEVATLVIKPLVPVEKDIVNFWLIEDSDVLQVSSSSGNAQDVVAVVPGQSVTFRKTGPGVVKEWGLDGKAVATSGESYVFSSSAIGFHSVSLIVTYEKKVYSQTVRIRVQ